MAETNCFRVTTSIAFKTRFEVMAVRNFCVKLLCIEQKVPKVEREKEIELD